ncbi:RagB/SusD family nutrient uptake outer membrane protein [Hymenobacter sediminis]|uniref:RagB/SusD family nutrient uptake outer membrane protein n=1 Tax=Hymenobacter sediminis TaxID=2218621 RepID=UPI000DA66C05|nr:RagB/SusD family nutrient uptake outer membrane protein [Hymenobacter sediminis]RPD48335.1 RagB/SusD family nutrient uptake outer membrane protein [Hymenobacter sediminis]
MKKILFSGSALALMLALASCDKDTLDENPRSVLVPGFFGTPDGIQAGLVGVYSGLRNITADQGGSNFMSQGTDEFMRGFSGSDGYEDYNAGLMSATNGTATNLWNTFYGNINTANGVIQYAGSVQGLPAATVTQIVAETKVLRAWNYFYLVQSFGAVPLTLSFVDSPTKDFSRAPVADVYNAIIQDLNDALGNPNAQGVPTTTSIANAAAQPGRVTRATALHLLAKVYLTRATSVAKAPDDYAKAAQYAEELIRDASKYGKGLEADPAQVFVEGNENGKEVLMNVQFNADPTFTGISDNGAGGAGQNQTNFLFRVRYDFLPNMARSIPYGRPFGRLGSTPYLLDSYKLATETNPREWRSTDTRYAKWFSTLWLVNSPGGNGGTAFNPKAVVGDTAAWYAGREISAAEQTRINNRPNGRYVVGTPSTYTTQFSPYINKFDDATRAALNNSSDRPLIFYRLAETYLIAAEANMYLGSTGKAVDQINTIRRRAAAPGKTAQMEITAAQLNIDFILDERTRELCGEFTRWYDLVRTGKLVERVKKYVPAYVGSKPSPIPGVSDNYGSDAARNIQPFHVLRPIPQQEIDRTGGKITQNPGYN